MPQNSESPLAQPFVFPNGASLQNRIAKAAMEEGIADQDFLPGPALFNLYRRWAQGGAGLLITGNVMVDPAGVTGPGNVIVRDEGHLDRFQRWAEIAQSGGSKLWMQINHPGRQMYAYLSETPVAPSAVAVNIPGRLTAKQFKTPRALTGDDIRKRIDRFVAAAVFAEKAGFHGVEVHAAHGYLLSQFLSPLANRREDEWGGSLENRSRMLLEIVKRIRSSVKREFCVGVKLNSADFQRGGFGEEDAMKVVQLLNPTGIDLLEISGGNFESPAMLGGESQGTRKREAYFLEFAAQAKKVAAMPLMATGGFRSRSIMEEAIRSGAVDIVGLGAPFALDPECGVKLLSGKSEKVTVQIPALSNPALNSIARMTAIRLQLSRMGKGKNPRLPFSLIWNLIANQIRARRSSARYKKFLSNVKF
jgi:2,4-dienoyl-CoA reductase-like NADH-dependent reductase (Old Yellow Enzyme family)